ncbi:MAG: hypothetical protein ACRBBK_07420 [Paracoccaceae bacterium]
MTEDTTQTITTNPMAIRFDWQDWLPYLEGSDLPDEKKKEFLLSLHAIVMGCVDLGFHLNPAQEICGEVFDLKAVLEDAVLESKVPSDQNEGDAA